MKYLILSIALLLLSTALRADTRWTSPFVLLYTSNVWQGWQVIDGSMTILGDLTVNGNCIGCGSGGSGDGGYPDLLITTGTYAATTGRIVLNELTVTGNMISFDQ